MGQDQAARGAREEADRRVQAPPAAIDLAHLSRMTLGDRRLQQEILDLFDEQIELLITRMKGRGDADLAMLAHTLKGAARSIGATDLAQAAAAVETAAKAGALDDALAAVDVAGAQVRSAISRMRQNEAAPQPRL